jgi:cytoskeleton protein RodZ
MSDVEARTRDKPALAEAAAGAQTTRIAIRAEQGMRDAEGSFGRALAAAREARGLTQSDVAAQLRLHPRQVKAIEEEDLTALPEGPFVRGYLRNFARLVELPAEPLLSLLNAKLRPTEPLRVEAGGSKAVSPIQRMPREPMSGPWVLGGAVAALVVFALFGWWTMRTGPQEEAAETKAMSAAGDAASVAQASASAVPQEQVPAAAAAAPPPVAVESAAGDQPAAAASGTALRLSFRDRSWVEIRQADGAVLLSQNNAAGTVQTIDGVPPYTLVIGNASKVDLEFRGKPVDLATASSRDDVARLRLE